MFFRLLLLLALAAPLFAQAADDVTRFLTDFRAQFVATAVDQTATRASLAELTRRAAEAADPKQKAQFYRGIASTELLLHDRDAAIAALRVAHDLLPADGETSGMLALLLAANHQLLEASAIFGADAGDAEALLRHADHLVDDGQKDLAIACLRQAQSLLPDNGDVDDRLGVAYLRVPRVDDALRELNRAAEKIPGSAVIHLHLAYAFAQKDYREYAGDELNRAVQCHPSDQILQGIRELRALLAAPR